MAARAENSNFDLLRTVTRDKSVELFLKVLASVMWDEGEDLQRYANEKHYDMAHDVHEALIFLGGFMRNVHSKVFKHYFKWNKLCKRTIFKLLKNYSRSMEANCENIFFVWLHSFTLVDSLLHYLEEKNIKEENDNIRTLAPTWWEYIFYKIIKTKFLVEGSWDGFSEYILRDFYPNRIPENCEEIWQVPLSNLNFNFSELEVSDGENYPKSDEDCDQEEQMDTKENEPNNIPSQLDGKTFNPKCVPNHAIHTEEKGRILTQCDKSSVNQISTRNLQSTMNTTKSDKPISSKDCAPANAPGNLWKRQESVDYQKLCYTQISGFVPKKRRNPNSQIVFLSPAVAETVNIGRPVLRSDPKSDDKEACSRVNTRAEKIETASPFKVLYPDNASVPSHQCSNLSKASRVEQSENKQDMSTPITKTESIRPLVSPEAGAPCVDQSQLATMAPQHLQNPQMCSPISETDRFDPPGKPECEAAHADQSQPATMSPQQPHADVNLMLTDMEIDALFHQFQKEDLS